MKISYDLDKHTKILQDRGIDFDDASLLFAGSHYSYPDLRQDYGELRVITVGYLNARMIVMVWTPRGNTHHIISMRKANAREQRAYQKRLS